MASATNKKVLIIKETDALNLARNKDGVIKQCGEERQNSPSARKYPWYLTLDPHQVTEVAQTKRILLVRSNCFHGNSIKTQTAELFWRAEGVCPTKVKWSSKNDRRTDWCRGTAENIGRFHVGRSISEGILFHLKTNCLLGKVCLQLEASTNLFSLYLSVIVFFFVCLWLLFRFSFSRFFLPAVSLDHLF